MRAMVPQNPLRMEGSSSLPASSSSGSVTQTGRQFWTVPPVSATPPESILTIAGLGTFLTQATAEVVAWSLQPLVSLRSQGQEG